MDDALGRRGAVILAGCALVAVGGCQASWNFEVGGDSVAAEEVAEQITSELEAQVGRPPESVTCPEDLPAELGAEITCTLEDAGQTFDVTVTVTNIEGSRVDYDFEVADRPRQ